MFRAADATQSIPECAADPAHSGAAIRFLRMWPFALLCGKVKIGRQAVHSAEDSEDHHRGKGSERRASVVTSNDSIHASTREKQGILFHAKHFEGSNAANSVSYVPAQWSRNAVMTYVGEGYSRGA